MSRIGQSKDEPVEIDLDVDDGREHFGAGTEQHLVELRKNPGRFISSNHVRLEREAQPGHHGRRGHTVARDVAHSERDAAIGNGNRVIPVAADLRTRWQIAGREIEPRNRGKAAR